MLAVTARERLAAFPDVPLMKEMGVVIERMGPAAYQKFVHSEYDRWGSYIKAAGITMDQ